MTHTERLAGVVLADTADSGCLAKVVVLAANADGVMFSGTFGILDSDRSIELDSIFSIASTTKAITSVAALQLVEEGLLNLDDPVHNYLP